MNTNAVARVRNQLQIGWKRLLDLDVLQWALPIFLAVTAIVFELVEHLQKDELMDPGFIGEMIIFGFVGPVIIRGLIVWMQALLTAQKKAAAEIHALNRDLEKKVDERTATLEQRNVELDRLNSELRGLDEMKSDFVALVSHELRAPLTALNGGLELALQSSDNLPARSRAILEIMTEESSRLTNFVQSILDVSRLDAGKLAITFGPVAVRPLVEQAAAIVLVSGQRKVVWEIASDLPPMWGDETYLEQAFRNLIANADKYSPADKPIEVYAAVSGNKIRISVKDHGPGISADAGEHIFDRFSRLQSEESSPPGWGLGLYLARKLVEAQNGEIGCLPSPQASAGVSTGSEFFILMPIARTPEDDLE